MPDDPATPPELDDDAYVATLDERARAIVARANADAAHRRHEVRTAEQQRDEERQRREELERQHEGDAERAIREAREDERTKLTAEHEQATGAIRTEHARQLATLAIQAKAAGKFTDPGDAVRYLDLEPLLAEEDEARREKAVDDALEQLLQAKPYLALQTGPRPPLVTPGARSGERPNGRTRERSWLRS